MHVEAVQVTQIMQTSRRYHCKQTMQRNNGEVTGSLTKTYWHHRSGKGVELQLEHIEVQTVEDVEDVEYALLAQNPLRSLSLGQIIELSFL